MEISRTVGALLALIGYGAYMWASAFRRLPDAPGLGSRRLWPWGHREYFTPAGYRLRLAGWLCGTIGAMWTFLVSRLLPWG